MFWGAQDISLIGAFYKDVDIHKIDFEPVVK